MKKYNIFSVIIIFFTMIMLLLRSNYIIGEHERNVELLREIIDVKREYVDMLENDINLYEEKLLILNEEIDTHSMAERAIYIRTLESLREERAEMRAHMEELGVSIRNNEEKPSQ